MKILGWVARVLAVVVVAVLLLDTFGGMLLDGPLGPIPGGRMSGPVSGDPHPDWSNLEQVVELEIRPSRPWSLSIWNAVIDGELYVPSAMGARRRWPEVALADPRVRLRTRGQIHELRIEKVNNPLLRARLGAAFAERYDFDPPASPEQDATWYFHLTPR